MLFRKVKYIVFYSFILLMCFIISSCTSVPEYIPGNYKEVYSQSFSSPKSINEFAFTDPDEWSISRGEEENFALDFSGKNEYVPEFRSPHSITLISNLKLSNFIMEADILQTGREYGHRDMCLFFGFQDPSHYYYAHMASQSDENAHNIFIVNNAPRTNISFISNEGINWEDKKWHKIRLVRNIEEGTIRLFFNDMEEPVMEARDTTFTKGYIGFGSFDDSRRIDNIKIWAPEYEKIPVQFFKTKQNYSGT